MKRPVRALVLARFCAGRRPMLTFRPTRRDRRSGLLAFAVTLLHKKRLRKLPVWRLTESKLLRGPRSERGKFPMQILPPISLFRNPSRWRIVTGLGPTGPILIGVVLQRLKFRWTFRCSSFQRATLVVTVQLIRVIAWSVSLTVTLQRTVTHLQRTFIRK